MRTKQQVHCLTGHTNTAACVVSRPVDPQVISGSHDFTVRLWDLVAGKSMATLTNHKKSVRAMALHPTESTFMTGAADNIKQWYLPDGKFIQNLSGHNAVINGVAVNSDDVAVSGGDLLHLLNSSSVCYPPSRSFFFPSFFFFFSPSFFLFPLLYVWLPGSPAASVRWIFL